MDWLTLIGYEDTNAPQHIMLSRMLVAGLLGAIIGVERGLRTSHAGIRTHALIAIAAAMFTLLAFEIYEEARMTGSPQTDPIRAIEAVTAGIAFLGAGAIFRLRGGVHGLTTGAGMWLSGAVGIAAALGYYVVALAATVFAVVVLAVMRHLSHDLINHRRD